MHQLTTCILLVFPPVYLDIAQSSLDTATPEQISVSLDLKAVTGLSGRSVHVNESQVRALFDDFCYFLFYFCAFIGIAIVRRGVNCYTGLHLLRWAATTQILNLELLFAESRFPSSCKTRSRSIISGTVTIAVMASITVTRTSRISLTMSSMPIC